jgi:hypothetical protein
MLLLAAVSLTVYGLINARGPKTCGSNLYDDCGCSCAVGGAQCNCECECFDCTIMSGLGKCLVCCDQAWGNTPCVPINN